ncbi:hypothetical protein ACFY20_36455 [Streptomyces sp. NPDC001312]|uniref:hypothetical protein n=1 Tax=Streptomyces sp. NPDC001312 TaxID=3364561 RepID=UPI0036B4ABF1
MAQFPLRLSMSATGRGDDHLKLPRFPVSVVTERGLWLLSVAEPAILAPADACGSEQGTTA